MGNLHFRWLTSTLLTTPLQIYQWRNPNRTLKIDFTVMVEWGNLITDENWLEIWCINRMWYRRHTAHHQSVRCGCLVVHSEKFRHLLMWLSSAWVAHLREIHIAWHGRAEHSTNVHIELLIRIVKSLRQSLLSRFQMRCWCCYIRTAEKLKEHLWQIYPAIKQ